MKILINCSNLKIGGGLQVAHSFLYQIRKNEEYNFVVVLSSTLNRYINVDLFPSNFVFIVFDIKPSILNSLIGHNHFLDKTIEKFCIERVFTVFGPSYWRPKVKHICGFAKAQYIYKDSPYFETLSLVSRIKLNIKRQLHLYSFGKTSDTFVTELWDVSDKLKTVFPTNKIYTVTNTYNQVFVNPDSWSKKVKLESFNGSTFLTISANYPHKNLKIIPLVIEYLKKSKPDFKFRFVITIDHEDFFKIGGSLSEEIVLLGKMNIEDCPFLYQQADFMFLPTLLECFSASYPEAMIMDTPIITSDLPFARNICGKAAVYFDPLCPRSIGEKMYQLGTSIEQQLSLKSYAKDQVNTFDTSMARALKYLEIITE